MTDKEEGGARDATPQEKTTTTGRSPSTNEIAASTVTITIGGPPVAKARARVTRRGFVYTPAKTRRFEAHCRLAAQQAMDGRPPIAVPVRAEIVIDLPVP